MFKKLLLLLALCLSLMSFRTADERAAEALARRVMGSKASVVVFKQTDSKTDSYELLQQGNKVLIRGNNANSMAVGLNRYIQQYCLANVSWYDFNPVELPRVMPRVPHKVSGKVEVPIRFFLNYCTFGYTMPWWKWHQWERFIDWMALNGVNMPLAITGQEAVWQKVWRKYGMTDEQIRAYFTGPAHLPWQRMINIDRWQGPLPQSWIDGQVELQKRILSRERELNMTPVLPAFAGHIPAELEQTVPGIRTSRVGSWCHFGEQYRCTYLNPSDPLFARIQHDFLEEQTKLYGTDHIYGIDLFNEVSPPSWEPDTLAKISAGVYQSLAAFDPEAVWLQMGWLFINNPGGWTPERTKAYLTAVPQGRLIMLDYESDYTEIWRRTNHFYGQKFIWCYLGNFGGMTEIEGDYKHNARLLAGTKAEGGPEFAGIGSTLEGFGVNEPIYEAVLAQAWDTGVSFDEYIDNIADRHLGRIDPTFRDYWHYLVDNVCITHTSTGASGIINSHPNLEGRWHWTIDLRKGYDIANMEVALSLIEKVAATCAEQRRGTSDYFKFDLANARRQSIRNRALGVRDRFTSAYKAGDRAGMVAASEEFLGMCDQLVGVLSTRPEFSLSDWIRDARSWGTTKAEKDYFEMNARTIITMWGDTYELSDYANRDWDGLVETFYKVRWKMFFDAVLAAYDAGEPFVNLRGPRVPNGKTKEECARALRLDSAIWDFETKWAHIK
ncbi:MAG: alpha-N-acetylglucosaminidase [Bacteroidaceae bacterium]|nr:alpha-N-acetylglucosaminidase [Bacteroidaceae bacterium]